MDPVLSLVVGLFIGSGLVFAGLFMSRKRAAAGDADDLSIEDMQKILADLGDTNVIEATFELGMRRCESDDNMAEAFIRVAVGGDNKEVMVFSVKTIEQNDTITTLLREPGSDRWEPVPDVKGYLLGYAMKNKDALIATAEAQG